MSDERDSTSPLAHEHLLLGATLGDVPGCGSAPLGYAGEVPFDEAGCAAFDLSGLLVARMSGADAPSFVNAACAHAALQVGECAFSATLMGDGSLASVPLIARTGDHEYVALDLSARQEVLGEWLLWLSSAEQGGVRAFPDIHVEDASDALFPLLLAGHAAQGVLEDYLAEGAEVPREGHIASLELDGRPCIVACLAHTSFPAYVLLVPPAFSVLLWRSLMSFPELAPQGRTALDLMLASELPFWESLAQAGRLQMGEQELLDFAIARPDGGYVGYRGLVQGE